MQRPYLSRLPGLLAAVAVGACDSTTAMPDPDPPIGDEVTLTEVAAGLDRPTTLTAPPGDTRLFVTEQSGRIRVIEDGVVRTTPFLDLSGLTTGAGERGLLGLAFHPDYASNGRFFVNYTDLGGDTRVVEYSVGADPSAADPASGTELLFLEQPAGNHNGGALAFGPDGMLFISTGDGGGANDTFGHGQDVTTLHGGLLRLDVSTPGVAAIPPDNPFAGRPEDGAEELWAWGLRNPWRFSFDLDTELLYIADVGQNRWEEVNVAPASEPGLNYGWPIMEGPECLSGSDCDRTGLTEPVAYYSIQGEPCAIIGGGVYRGERIPGLRGRYLYSDLCAGFLRSFRYQDGVVREEMEFAPRAGQVGSMGQGADGELYVLTRDGRVLRLDPAPLD